MEAYAEYKDSGVDWLGQIPTDWGVERAKWLFSKAERGVRANDEIVTCFRDGTVTLRKNRRTDGFTTALKEHGYQGIRRGDLVIHAMDAFAGAIGVSDSDGKSTPVYAACVPRNEKTVDVHFYAYFIRDLALSGFLISLAKGIRERSTDFRFRDFAELEVSSPPLPEQTAIAGFLDDKVGKVEELVEIKQAQIALLKERKQILIQEAVTKGLNPDAPMKDSGIDWIGQIPAHWEVKRIKYVASITPGFAFKSSDFTAKKNTYKLLRGINVNPGKTSWRETVYWNSEQTDLIDTYSLACGDIVIGMDRPWVGGGIRVAEITASDLPALLLQRVARIRSTPDTHNSFIRLLITSRQFLSYFEPILTGISVPHISDSQIGNFSCAIPPSNEQKDIFEFCMKMENEILDAITIKENQITKLNEYKVTLINAAVTGKIKVPEQYFSKDD